MKSKQTHRVVAAARSEHLLAADVVVPETWRRHHARLLELREKVIGDWTELADEVAESTTEPGMHPADGATDCFDRNLAFSLLSYEQNALSEINDALKRILAGTYGVCELTGQPSPRRRLEAIPWARHTVQAQATLENASEIPTPNSKGA
jgi:DnaK suppressor protein